MLAGGHAGVAAIRLAIADGGPQSRGGSHAGPLRRNWRRAGILSQNEAKSVKWGRNG